MAENERSFSEKIGRVGVIALVLFIGGRVVYLYLTSEDGINISPTSLAPEDFDQYPQVLLTPTPSFPSSETSPNTLPSIEGQIPIPDWFMQEFGLRGEDLIRFPTTRELADYLRTIPPRPDDVKYTGIYFNEGDLHSSPESLFTIASFYDVNKYRGKVTGFGFPFDENKHWGSSWDFAAGTVVYVINHANNTGTFVMINDRGPNSVKYPNRRIDLTPTAFDDIQYLIHGVADVEVIPVAYVKSFRKFHPQPEASSLAIKVASKPFPKRGPYF